MRDFSWTRRPAIRVQVYIFTASVLMMANSVSSESLEGQNIMLVMSIGRS